MLRVRTDQRCGMACPRPGAAGLQLERAGERNGKLNRVMRVHCAVARAVADPQAAAVPRQYASDAGDPAALAPGRHCLTIRPHGVLPPRREVSRFVQVRPARAAQNSFSRMRRIRSMNHYLLERNDGNQHGEGV
jgi:hypothetical protein